MSTPSRVLQSLRQAAAPAAGFRPLMAAHWLALEELGSPLVAQQDRRASFLDYAMAALLMRADAGAAEALAADEPALHARARALCREMPAEDMRGLCAAVVEHLRSGLGPAAQGEAKPPPEETPPDPKRPGRRRTSSARG